MAIQIDGKRHIAVRLGRGRVVGERGGSCEGASGSPPCGRYRRQGWQRCSATTASRPPGGAAAASVAAAGTAVAAAPAPEGYTGHPGWGPLAGGATVAHAPFAVCQTGCVQSTAGNGWGSVRGGGVGLILDTVGGSLTLTGLCTCGGEGSAEWPYGTHPLGGAGRIWWCKGLANPPIGARSRRVPTAWPRPAWPRRRRICRHRLPTRSVVGTRHDGAC